MVERSNDVDSSFSSNKRSEPDYLNTKYTEYDPLKLHVVDSKNNKLHLMTYRMCVPEGTQKKGILFYIHGINGHCANSGFLFKYFSINGYETLAFDQRGAGKSEGQRAYLGGDEFLYKTIHEFIEKAIQFYSIDTAITPLFLIGYSFGGLTALNYGIKHPGMFKAVVSIAPGFEFIDKTIKKSMWLFKTMNAFVPKFKIGIKHQDKHQEFKEKYQQIFNDPLQNKIIRIQSIVIWNKQYKFLQENLKNAVFPVLMILAENDDQFDNKVSKRILEQLPNKLNKVIEFINSDHATIMIGFGENIKLATIVSEFFDKFTGGISEQSQQI